MYLTVPDEPGSGQDDLAPLGEVVGTPLLIHQQSRHARFADGVDEPEEEKHEALSKRLRPQSRASSARRRNLASFGSQASLYSMASTRGYTMEGLDGEQVFVRQRWLADWVKELKSRLPPFELKRLHLDELPENNLTEDDVLGVLAELPAHEVARFEVMFSRTVNMVDSMAAAMDPDFIHSHIAAALERFRETKRQYISASYAREAQEREEHSKAKPWEYAVNAFNGRVQAATLIQQRFRKWKQQCEYQGWFPSDENPKHWKHWAEFREKHGWSYEELVDEEGNPRERTDGGKWKKGLSFDPNVKARYMDAIHHMRGDKRPADTSRSIASMEAEIQNAMRSYERAQRLAQILANRWLDLQNRDARRAAWRAAAAERRRLAGVTGDEESDWDSDESDEDDILGEGQDIVGDDGQPLSKTERKKRKKYLKLIADPEVRKLVEEGITSTDFMNALNALSAPNVRELHTDMTKITGKDKNSMSSILKSFQIAHQYRQRLLAAKAAGQLPPEPPKELEPDVLNAYTDVKEAVFIQYELDLERALRQGEEPPMPPWNAPKRLSRMYKEAMKHLKATKEANAHEQEQTGQRVRQLGKYGKAWLDAFDGSTAARRRLLRTRSQGNLGVQNAALYRAEGVADLATPKFKKSPSQMQKDTQLTGFEKPMKEGQDVEKESSGEEIDPWGQGKSPLKRFSFKDLCPEHATTLQPITASVAFKLHSSVAANKARTQRPLVLVDTLKMEGMDWTPTSHAPEGRELNTRLTRVTRYEGPQDEDAITPSSRSVKIVTPDGSGAGTPTGTPRQGRANGSRMASPTKARRSLAAPQGATTRKTPQANDGSRPFLIYHDEDSFAAQEEAEQQQYLGPQLSQSQSQDPRSLANFQGQQGYISIPTSTHAGDALSPSSSLPLVPSMTATDGAALQALIAVGSKSSRFKSTPVGASRPGQAASRSTTMQRSNTSKSSVFDQPGGLAFAPLMPGGLSDTANAFANVVQAAMMVAKDGGSTSRPSSASPLRPSSGHEPRRPFQVNTDGMDVQPSEDGTLPHRDSAMSYMTSSPGAGTDMLSPSSQGVGERVGSSSGVDAFAVLLRPRKKVTRASVAQIIGKDSKAAVLWRRARNAVQRLLASYSPEARDMLREAGLTGTGPQQLLEKAMALLRTPKVMQMEDGGAIIVARTRPLSAGSTRDIDRQAAAAVARQGAVVNTIANADALEPGEKRRKALLPDMRVMEHKLANLTGGGLERGADMPSTPGSLTSTAAAGASRRFTPSQMQSMAARQVGSGQWNGLVEGRGSSMVPEQGWGSMTRTLSMGGLSRATSTRSGRGQSAGSKGDRSQQEQQLQGDGADALRPTGGLQDEDTYIYQSEKSSGTVADPGSASGEVEKGSLKQRLQLLSSGGSAWQRAQQGMSGQQPSRPALTTLGEERSVFYEVAYEEPAAPRLQMGSLLADVFWEQQRMAKAEQAALAAGTPNADVQGAGTADAEAPKQASAEQVLLDHYRQKQIAITQPGGGGLFGIRSVPIAQLTPSQRHAMKQRYMKVFKSGQYGWLNEHLRMGVVPERLVAFPEDEDEDSGSDMMYSSQPGPARITRATQRRLARLAQSTPNPLSGSPRSSAAGKADDITRSAAFAKLPAWARRKFLQEGNFDAKTAKGLHTAEGVSGNNGAMGSSIQGQGDANAAGGGDMANAISGSGAQVSPSEMAEYQERLWSAVSNPKPRPAHLRGRTAARVGDVPTLLLTVKPQDWGCWGSIDEDGDSVSSAPGWLARLLVRMSYTHKMGLTQASAQRQRFQMASALAERMLGPPADMRDALTVHKPQTPQEPLLPTDPTAATLPGSRTRLVTVDSSMQGACSHSLGGVVAAPPVPISDLSPPRQRPAPELQEVLTPFGPRMVPLPPPPPPPQEEKSRYAGVTSRPVSHAAMMDADSAGLSSPRQGRSGDPARYTVPSAPAGLYRLNTKAGGYSLPQVNSISVPPTRGAAARDLLSSRGAAGYHLHAMHAPAPGSALQAGALRASATQSLHMASQAGPTPAQRSHTPTTPMHKQQKQKESASLVRGVEAGSTVHIQGFSEGGVGAWSVKSHQATDLCA